MCVKFDTPELLCLRSLDFEPALQHSSALNVICAIDVFDRARAIIVTAHCRLDDASVGELRRSAGTGGIHPCENGIEHIPARVLLLGLRFYEYFLQLNPVDLSSSLGVVDRK